MHILINSLQRSGGTLLARLLDAHPAIHSLPFELLYAPQKVRLPDDYELRGLSGDWDDFRRTLQFERNFGRVAKQRHFSKDQYGRTPIDFDYRKFEAMVAAWHRESDGRRLFADAVAACIDAFFESWPGGNAGQAKPIHVNHLSMMCFASPVRFFELFPDGRTFQTVRDPLSWYASMKQHFGIADLDLTYMSYALEVWVEATLRGMIAARYWPHRYALIRYGDLTDSGPAVMRYLARFLGIEFQDVLSEPTLGGRPWLGNSSFGPRVGFEKTVSDQWRQSLVTDEVDVVSQCAGELGEIVSKLQGWGGSGFPDRVQHPSSGNFEPIAMASVEELLSNESRRMSVLTHRMFTQTLQRAHGARYRKPHGLAARLKRASGHRLGRRLLQILR